MTTISESIREGYQKRFKRFGGRAQSLSWSNIGAAHQRFRQIWADMDFSNKSVLDVGCGFGYLGKFLTKKFENVKYTGVDIVPEFIDKAKLRRPNLTFFVRDYLFDPIPEIFDIVVASGILNGNVPNNMDYRKSAIKTMFDHAHEALIFNMLGTHPQIETASKSNVWYADSLEILDYCMSLSPRVIFRSSYNPKDFTIIMYKKKLKKAS